MRLDEDGAQEKYMYVNDLIVDEFNIDMETTVGDASWINRKNEYQNISINNTVK